MIRFIRLNRRWLAGGLLLTLFSSFGQTFFIGLSGRYILEEFSLSDGEFGSIYMACTLLSALTLPWLGHLLDRYRGGRVVLFVMPVLAGACLLMAFAPHVALLALAIYLLRLMGQGMMTHIALTEVSRWFDANRGRAISLVVPGHQVGEALLPLVFAAIALPFGWRWAWIASAGLILLVALPVIHGLIKADRVPTEHGDDAPAVQGVRQWTRGEVLRDPQFYLMLAGVLAPSFVGTTIFFHQAHLTDVRGYPPLVFATAFPLMAVTTIVFGLVSGHLIDRFGSVRILPYFLGPLIAATSVASFVEAQAGIYVFMVMLGVSYGLTSTMFGALWPEIYGVRYLGAIRSIVVAAMVFGTAMGPGITGALIDAGIDLPRQLGWMAAWSLLATIGLTVASRKIRDRKAMALAPD